jgi:hypothetical protein
VTTPGPADLHVRLFRALYQDLDLHQAGSLYIVAPKGTPLLASRSLADIARQLTTRPGPASRPAAPPRPSRGTTKTARRSQGPADR